MRIAVIMACFNRRDATVRSIASVLAETREHRKIDVHVLDDGSTDGTPEALRSSGPCVKIAEGDGSFYWTRGMATAFAQALAADYDFYLWLNDDVALDAGFLDRLLDTHDTMRGRSGKPALVVGSCRSADGTTTYGGMRLAARRLTLRTQLIEPGEAPVACETLNGNCVLIPRAVTDRIGNLDAKFFHNYGDIDYGLRAGAAGCGNWIAPGTIGICEKNARKERVGRLWTEGTLRQRWAELTKPEIFHFPSWLRLTRRHVPVFWPVAALGPLRRFLIP